MITRLEARGRIADAVVARMAASERAEVLEEWWTLDADDEEWSSLPEDLQRELARAESPESSAVATKYDSLLKLAAMTQTLGVQNSWLETRLAALGHPEKVLGDLEEMVCCRCCGYRSLRERGNYEICPVCFWEDDGVRSPDEFSGPNHMTLGKGQENFSRLGACREDFLPHIDPEATAKYPRRVAVE